MSIIENELFQRPASYWLRRAERLKQSGDLIRAAVLERHAVRAEPENDAARMSYAFTLRQLHCYEASNREAFAALAHDPSRTPLLGLIGQNMFNLGQRQTGLDAMNLYAARPPAVPPVWQDEAYDMADAYDYPFQRSKRRARLRGLIRIATRRIAAGDLEAAARALGRASEPPFYAPSAQRDLTMAACFLRLGDRVRCVTCAQHAIALRPHDLKVRISAIMLMHSAGFRAKTRSMLLSAALAVRSPVDELLLLTACDEMRMPQIAWVMLSRSIARKADRFPTCYNLCVCLLRFGRLAHAMRYIHLCREIDPDDVQGEILFNRLIALEQQQPTPAQVRKAAASFSWYGLLSQVEVAACAEPLWPVIGEGTQTLADTLLADERLRRRLLYLLALPLEWPPMLLASLEPVMPREDLITLLRETLMQHPGATLGKKYAVAMLQHLGVEPPYLTWTDDRLGMMDPTRVAQGSPTFLQRILTLRIRQAAKLGSRDLIPWAMTLVTRMTKAERRELINDHMHIWPAAFAMAFRSANGLAPLRIRPSAFTPMRAEYLKQALRLIHQLERRHDFHEDH